MTEMHCTTKEWHALHDAKRLAESRWLNACRERDSAKSENNYLRAELADLNHAKAWQAETIESLQAGMHPADLVNEVSIELWQRNQKQQAAIARVRALCADDIDYRGVQAWWSREILRALDGAK